MIIKRSNGRIPLAQGFPYSTGVSWGSQGKPDIFSFSIMTGERDDGSTFSVIVSMTREERGAVAGCMDAFAALEVAADALETACSDLREVQSEYEEWKDNLSENLQSSPVAEKLDAVCDLAIEDLANDVRTAIEEAKGVIEEAEGIDLPLGFGRD